jgi:uncharacterized membrane protein
VKAFEERLASASAEWVSSGLISGDQRRAILERHPAGRGCGSRFIGIVATIGGLLFAVGVSLVIKANWEMIGDWTKIGGLVALLIAAYLGGWKLKVVDHHLARTGDAALMVGGIFFLCGIALVSQIFHLNSRPASGVFLWWLGIAAVPWLARAKGAQFLSLVAGLVWLAMEMHTPGSWLEVGRLGLREHNEATFLAVFLVLGLAVWLAGLGLRGTRWEDFAGLHEKWGILLTFAALYCLSFVRHFWVFSHHGAGLTERSNFVAIGLSLAALLAAAFAAWRRSPREMRLLGPWLALAVVPGFGVITMGPLLEHAWAWSGLAWLTLFVLSVMVVRVGLDSGREGWVNLGILCIATNIVTRYFDLFGSMLEGGVFFIVTGVMVTSLGIYLEKKRRTLVAGLRREASA